MPDPNDPTATIRRAFVDAQARRPYVENDALIRAVTPPGGDWSVEAKPGAVTRSVMWDRVEVALVNPGSHLRDSVEADIAMALRAAPAFDAALRVILVLAEDANNLPLIRDLAIALVAFIELPAPAIPEPEEEEC